MTNEVPAAGIEPRTFRLLGECANHCAKPAGFKIGNENENAVCDGIIVWLQWSTANHVDCNSLRIWHGNVA